MNDVENMKRYVELAAGYASDAGDWKLEEHLYEVINYLASSQMEGKVNE